jgi:hypothetical protein
MTMFGSAGLRLVDEKRRDEAAHGDGLIGEVPQLRRNVEAGRSNDEDPGDKVLCFGVRAVHYGPRRPTYDLPAVLERWRTYFRVARLHEPSHPLGPLREVGADLCGGRRGLVDRASSRQLYRRLE